MRHRIKKIPTLSNKSHHLLHSDKSTYTALRFGHFSRRKVPNDKRPVLFSPEKRGFLEKMKSYVWPARLAQSSHNTYFYNNTNGKIGSKIGSKLSILYSNKISTIPLVLSAFGLLLVLGCMISPSMAAGGSGGVLGRADKASAVEQDFGAGRTVSLSIINNGNTLADGDTVSTNVETPGTVSYIDDTIRINTNKIAKYYVGVQAASDGSSDLTGSKYGETIAGVGSNVSPDNFGDNTWGYSLTDNTAVANSTLTYSTLPAYNTNSPLQYTSTTNPADGNHDLKLTFAAKINANKPSDHYQTKAMVSVAADAKSLLDIALDSAKGFGSVKTMQEFDNSVCGTIPMPSSTNVNVTTGELVDVRDASIYTVSKLSDGKCWMTQNLRIVNKAITSADSDVTSNYTIPASSAPWSDTQATTNKVHYANNTTYGAYYTWYAATAGTALIGTDAEVKDKNAPSSICPKGWKLPTSKAGGEFEALVNKGKSSWTTNGGVNGYWLGGTGNVVGAAFFPAGGVVYNGSLQSVNNDGRYWSSTAYSTSQAYNLILLPDNFGSSNFNDRYSGYSIRCMIYNGGESSTS